MTKEEWVKVREEPHIPLGVWFSYYKDNGGDIDDPVEFEDRFNEIINAHHIFFSEMYQTLMHVTQQTAKARLFNYYDSIYDI